MKRLFRSFLTLSFLVAAIGVAQAEDTEMCLYSTDFTDWTEDTSKGDLVNNLTTKYTNEDFTISTVMTTWRPAGSESKFGGLIGYLQMEKDATASITISTISSVTRIEYTQGITGSNRGAAFEVKGDGDDDWVSINSTLQSSTGAQEYSFDINRTNCQMRFTNTLTTSAQYAMLIDLKIYGNVDMSEQPTLGTFEINGTSYTAIDIFTDETSTESSATIALASSDAMINGTTNVLENVTAANGELGEITYTPASDGESCVVVIPVTYDGTTKNYTLTVERKPWYTLTYINVDGSTIGTQSVEEDATITAFSYDETSVTVADGQAFRGWAQKLSGSANRKYTTDDVVTSDLSLYALVTDIETASTSARYTYLLTDRYFYPEDHEAFNPTGSGAWHDTTHGYSFSNGDQIDVLVGGDAYLIFTLCRYSGNGTIDIYNGDTLLESISAVMSTDAATGSYYYKGEATTLTIKFNVTTYMHKFIIANMTDNPVEVGDNGYYMVEAGNTQHLLNTLMIANANSSDERTYIFLPDGTYDLGETTLTSISGSNISLIGESMEGTIIVNAPLKENEGISVTATIYNTSSNLYMQDLTLKNALDYYGAQAAGQSGARAVCLQDKGNQTICKNVELASYQDTYYSNKSGGQFYFETSKIHGTVDFVCGEGDVIYNQTEIVVEKRKEDGSGECTIAAPSANQTWGYVFLDCTITNYAAKFNYGRAWNNSPDLVYINTTFAGDAADKIISTRFNTTSINEIYPHLFAEYNSMNEEGTVVSPSSNMVTFAAKSGATADAVETILTDTEAAQYTIDNIFGTWAPDSLAAQIEAPAVTIADGVASWEAPADAIAFLIYVDGELKSLVASSTTSYTLEAGETTVQVRAANSMGGFGELSATEEDGNAISDIDATSEVVATEIYNVSGQRLLEPQRGINLVRTIMSDGSVQVSRVLVK